MLVAAAAALAGGCGGGAQPPTAVTLATACDADNAGRHVVVDGYLRFPDRLRISRTTQIAMFSALGGAGDRQRVEFTIGDEPNQLERPALQYTPTSLRVRAANGVEVTINDRVRVTAKVAHDGSGCLLRTPQVEVLPRAS